MVVNGILCFTSEFPDTAKILLTLSLHTYKCPPGTAHANSTIRRDKFTISHFILDVVLAFLQP